MSGLLRRIQSLEGNTPPADRGDGEPEWTRAVLAMSEQEVDNILKNLLLAGGAPDDPRLAAIWQRAIEESVDALEAAEFDALHEWIMTG